MPTYREIDARIGMYLGEPHPAYPSEPVRWRYLADCAQLLFNQALNSPANWAIQSVDVTVQPGQEVYELQASNFGKDVLIHTIDATDPNHIETPVRRMSLQSSLLGGNDNYARQSFYPFAGLKHTVQTFVFFRENGHPFFKILPANVPQSADYRIYYEEAEINTDNEANAFPLPPAGVPYLCAYTAAMLLPLTRWCGMTEEQNAIKRKEFGATLPSMVTSLEKEWRRYLATDRKAGLTVMRGFDDSNYMTDVGWY